MSKPVAEIAGHETEFAGEYDSAFDPDGDVQQGDILQLLSADDGEDWSSHFGIVLTANCDLVHRKHGGVLSYAPVVPLDMYARAILLPRVIDTEIRRSESLLQDALPREDNWPTYDRLIEMVQIGEAVDSVCQSLPDEPEVSAVRPKVERLHAVLECHRSYSDSLTISDALSIVEGLLQRLRAIDGYKARPPWQALGKELHGRLTKSLPGDCLFIDKMSPEHRAGYVAYLRLIREIRHGSIARSAVEERRLGVSATARRIGRLRVLYLHRLTQQLVKVFADIGLPEDYESNWDRVVLDHVQNWRSIVSEAPGPELVARRLEKE